MYVSRLGEASLDLPEKPTNPDIDYLANAALEWVQANMPYDYYCNRDVYKPEIAMKRSGGNCYAQALGGISLLNAWGIACGISLDTNHANVVMAIDEDIRFIDASVPYNLLNVRDEKNEANRRSDPLSSLRKIYLERLPSALSAGNFSYVFYQDQASDLPLWRLVSNTTIRGHADMDVLRNPHIVLDAMQGYQTLCAIGDITRYSRMNQDTLPPSKENYYVDLIDNVPDFIEPRDDKPHTETH